jgi:hypothetical protein
MRCTVCIENVHTIAVFGHRAGQTGTAPAVIEA